MKSEEGEGRLKRWRLGARDDRAASLGDALGLSPLVAQVLCRRGVNGVDDAQQFLDPRLNGLHDPAALSGCSQAAERLARALRAGEPVAVYGDYDVDGITATAILYHALRSADPRARILRYVPNRLGDGYGLHEEAIGRLAEEGAKVIVSVDCGITAQGPAAAALQRGVDLIITDHHELPRDGELPPALAHVHPALPGASGEPYPFRGLCGAGVAYKLAWQFARAWCGSERVSPKFREMLLDLLPLAALGTIADMVPLLDENRVIATCGLRHIKATRLEGLNALIDATHLRGERIDSSHVGFVIGPRLNACGRMGHADQALDLLTIARAEDAERIARDLDRFNEERRAIEAVIYGEARALIEAKGYADEGSRVLVLGSPGWHAGVIGIVCSRLVERYGRPAVLLHTDGDEAGGSARSIEGFDIIGAFAACSERLTSFGGHQMAAGLSLPTKEIDAFRDAINRFAEEHLSAEEAVPMVEVDAEVGLDALSLGVCEQLERLAPFGAANPAPLVLVRDARLIATPKRMGQDRRHAALTVEQHGQQVRCVGWRMGELVAALRAGTRLDVVGEPRINRYRGRSSVELDIKDLRWGQ